MYFGHHKIGIKRAEYRKLKFKIKTYQHQQKYTFFIKLKLLSSYLLSISLISRVSWSNSSKFYLVFFFDGLSITNGILEHFIILHFIFFLRVEFLLLFSNLIVSLFFFSNISTSIFSSVLEAGLHDTIGRLFFFLVNFKGSIDKNSPVVWSVYFFPTSNFYFSLSFVRYRDGVWILRNEDLTFFVVYFFFLPFPPLLLESEGLGVLVSMDFL